MKIRIECIHRKRESYDNVSCCFVNSVDNEFFHLPSTTVCLIDVLLLSNKMKANCVYDCVLEIESFIIVKLNTNHPKAIRGIYWNSVPDKYCKIYSLFKFQKCIEVNNEIILLSPYTNVLDNKVEDGKYVEVIPQSPYNLKAVTELGYYEKLFKL